jgi:periplasmic protein TonB
MSASAVTTGLIQPLRQERVLLWCVLASIALHALVLLGISRRGVPVPGVTPLSVLTARLAPAATAPAQPPQREANFAPATPAKHPLAPRPALTPPVAAPRPAPQPAAAAEAEKSTPREPAPEPAAPGTGAPGAAAGASSQTGPAPQAQAGVKADAAKSGGDIDKGTLEQYRLALIAAAGQYKRYPAIAMEKGWQGRVEVRMVIGANGMLAGASIKTSSGHVILDNQAIDMLRKGKTMVQIPASLRGREFSLDVPVIFTLDNPDS